MPNQWQNHHAIMFGDSPCSDFLERQSYLCTTLPAELVWLCFSFTYNTETSRSVLLLDTCYSLMLEMSSLSYSHPAAICSETWKWHVGLLQILALYIKHIHRCVKTTRSLRWWLCKPGTFTGTFPHKCEKTAWAFQRILSNAKNDARNVIIYLFKNG